MTEAESERLAWLVDRAEIADVIGRYCYSIDRRDWESLRTCFGTEVEIGIGGVGRVSGERWVQMVAAAFEGQPRSQHLKVPVSYEIDADEALVVSLLQGKHWRPSAAGGGPLHTVVGYYRERFARTPAGWRIASFEEEVDWNEGNAEIQDAMTRQLLAEFERG